MVDDEEGSAPSAAPARRAGAAAVADPGAGVRRQDADLPTGDDAPGGPRNRYEIRILPDGRVVFVDLPGGLAEVAQVVAGSAPETQRLDAGMAGDEG
jgi:hypothetical protein